MYCTKDEAFEACFWVCRVARDKLVWVELFFECFESYFVVFNCHCDVKDVNACFEFGEEPHQGGGVVQIFFEGIPTCGLLGNCMCFVADPDACAVVDKASVKVDFVIFAYDIFFNLCNVDVSNRAGC